MSTPTSATFAAEAFRVRGRALAIVALSERFQVVGGVLYVNRNDTKLIPAGGCSTRRTRRRSCSWSFPQPKVARRIGCADGRAWWAYAAGEFGGGTWAYEQPAAASRLGRLNDYRVLLGTELKRPDGWLVRAEVGYVWGRELLPLNAPRVTPADTVMLRVGLVY